MKNELFPWLILFLPLLSVAVITLFTLRSKTVSSLISIGAVAAGFVMTCLFVNANGIHFSGETSVNWLTIGGLNVDFGLKLDALSMMMLFVVTGVGGLIHIYSYGYMDEDRGQGALFRVLESVHVLDARHRAREQFPDDVHFLGTGRRVQLPAHRFLV